MRNIYLLILLFITIAFACSKDDPPEPEPKCYISAITEGTDTLRQFFYDDKMRLAKYIHNKIGTSFIFFFEYNDQDLPVKASIFDTDSTIYYGCELLFYNNEDLLIKKETYPLSNDFELSSYYNYYYDEQNRLIKTETYYEGWTYPQFDTYEYDEEGKCIKVYKWYHVFTTGEVKLRQYYRYYYDTFSGTFNHLPFIFDGYSTRFGLFTFPNITKEYNITKLENFSELEDTDPYSYMDVIYEYNELGYPTLVNYITHFPSHEPFNDFINYHYITK